MIGLLLFVLAWSPRPAIATPLSSARLLDELSAAHVDVLGRAPSQRRLAMAWAHVALESGRGAHAVWFNWGNIGARVGHPFYRVGGASFEAFDSPAAGARRYWEVLSKRTKALACFDAGDASCAARALSGNYHRSDPAIYGAAMRSLFYGVLPSTPSPARGQELFPE